MTYGKREKIVLYMTFSLLYTVDGEREKFSRKLFS